MHACGWVVGVVAILVTLELSVFNMTRSSHDVLLVLPHGWDLDPSFRGLDSSPHPHYFQNSQNLWLSYRVWSPSSQAPRATVFIVHGLGDHSGWYDELASKLTESGYLVYAHDHQGFGKSEGNRGHFGRSVETIFTDFADFVGFVTTENKKNEVTQEQSPVFCIGFSLGATTVATAEMRNSGLCSGMVLISPGFAVHPNDTPSEFTKSAITFLSGLLPKMPFKNLAEPSLMSHDRNYVKKWEDDPLVVHNKLSLRSVATLLHHLNSLPDNFHQIEQPYLLLQGEEDKLTDPQAAKEFCTKTKSEDGTCKFYPNAYHNLLNEPEIKDDVFDQIQNWLNSHTTNTM